MAYGLDPGSVRGPNKPSAIDDQAHNGIQDKKLQQLQAKADMARIEYESGLEKLNLTIDMFDTSYRPILNRVQEQDDSQISFLRYNLEKLSRYLDQTGRDMRSNADEIS